MEKRLFVIANNLYLRSRAGTRHEIEELQSIVHDFLCKKNEVEQANKPEKSPLSAVQCSRFLCTVTNNNDEDKGSDNKSVDLPWTLDCEVKDHEAFSQSMVFVSSSGDDTEALAEKIHDITDTLPKYGCFVEVLWYFPGDSWRTLPLESNLALYGSLKRLSQWYQARISLVIPDYQYEPSNESPALEDWAELLCAPVITCGSLSDRNFSSLWHGGVLVHGKGKTVQLTGFCLSTLENAVGSARITFPEDETSVTNQVLGKQLELVCETTTSQIPSYLLSKHRYILSLTSDSPLLQRSQVLLDRLQESTNLCYIVRLPYGSSWKENFVPRSETSGQNLWRQMVIENPAHLGKCPFNAQLDGDLGYHHLLLTADSETSSLARSESNNSKPLHCVAYLLQPLTKLDGSLMHTLAMVEVTSPRTEITESERMKARDLLESLPYYSPALLTQLQKNIQTVQIEVLQAWIDDRQKQGKDLQISPESLMTLLSRSHDLYLKQVLPSLSLPKYKIPENCLKIIAPKPEFEQDTYKQIERLILQSHSAKQAAFDRQKSSDSLAGLGPPKDPADVVTLDVGEFLKCFKTDGTANKETRSQITTKKEGSGKLYKRSSDEVKNTAWPECTTIVHHGISYSNPLFEDTKKKKVPTATLR